MATIQHSSLTDSDGLHEPKGVATATSGDVYVADGAGSGSWDPLEGTEVASTGETGGNKYLREDGDNTCSWQVPVTEGTNILSTGETGGTKFLREDGDNTSSWQTVEGTDIGSTGPVAADRVLTSDGAGGATWGPPPGANFGTIGLYDSAGTAVGSIGTTAKNIGCFDTAGPATGITTSTGATGGLTVSIAGDYEVSFHCSFSTAAAGDAGVYQFRLRVNDVEGTGSQKCGARREMSGSSDTGSASFHGYLNLPLGTEKVTVWVESDDGGDSDDINVYDAVLTAILLEED